MADTPDTRETPTRVVDFEAALGEVIRRAAEARDIFFSRSSEEVALLDAAGRVLAQPILADRDQPPFNRATRDGFAVRASEFTAGRELRIIGQVRAGDLWTGDPLSTEEAIEIMTGAPLPAGADAVAMVEHVELGTHTIRALEARTLRPSENIVAKGAEARAGNAVVRAGAVITAAEIALAATSGQSTLSVSPKPAVAIVATGDELVEIHETPDARQIRNSNSYALAALVAEAGGSPHRFPIARDLREDILNRLAEARQHDLILFSGGVSMGKYDLVEEVLSELNAEFFFTGVRMQPGKPIVFGRLPERENAPARFFFGLPGNPISTQVTFHCFVDPFLQTLLGEFDAAPSFAQATLTHEVKGNPSLTRMLPAHLESKIRQPLVSLVGWQGSGDLAANARANCYAVFPAEDRQFYPGEVITILLR